MEGARRERIEERIEEVERHIHTQQENRCQTLFNVNERQLKGVS